MLQLMRKHAGSWIIKILLGAIALAFALSWGVSNYDERPLRLAMKINGEAVPQSDVDQVQTRLVEQAREQFGPNYDQIAPMLNLGQRAKDTVAERVLLNQAAQDMGLTVSDAEIRAKLMSMPAFQENGAFNLRRYEAILAANRLGPEEFEASLRGQLMLEKLSALVAGGAQVTPLEVDQALLAQLSQIKAAYLIIKPDEFKDQVKLDEGEYEKYYKDDQKLFMNPESLVVNYLLFPWADYRDQAQVSDDDVKEAYEEARSKYAKPEEVRARHILLKLSPDATPEQVKAAETKAKELLALLQAGADFATLAKEKSQGPSAPQGGDLGYFKRGDMVAPFEKAAFAMKTGEMKIIQSPFGIHIIKVEDHRPARVVPLEEVEGEIRQGLVEKQAKELAQAAAERAFDRLAQGGDPAKLARELKKDLKTSESLTSGQTPAGLPGLNGVFRLAEGLHPGQPVPATPYAQGSVVMLIKSRQAANPKPLAEVKDQIKVMLTDQKAAQLAQEKAREIIASLQGKPAPAQGLAEMPGAVTTGWLKPDADIPELPGSRTLVQALFLVPGGVGLVAEPQVQGREFAVAGVLERQAPDAKAMEEAKAATQERLLAAKQQGILQGFLEDLRSRAEILVPVQVTRQGWRLPGCQGGTETTWVKEGQAQ
ncbi:MAG: SurA N-terminal domain-containing protein [Deltaproteobacteria bacterium]|nr:SurA N-terminal domain-containing protein [Deltaproteobacteria bacterium]